MIELVNDLKMFHNVQLNNYNNIIIIRIYFNTILIEIYFSSTL